MERETLLNCLNHWANSKDVPIACSQKADIRVSPCSVCLEILHRPSDSQEITNSKHGVHPMVVTMSRNQQRKRGKQPISPGRIAVSIFDRLKRSKKNDRYPKQLPSLPHYWHVINNTSSYGKQQLLKWLERKSNQENGFRSSQKSNFWPHNRKRAEISQPSGPMSSQSEMLDPRLKFSSKPRKATTIWSFMNPADSSRRFTKYRCCFHQSSFHKPHKVQMLFRLSPFAIEKLRAKRKRVFRRTGEISNDLWSTNYKLSH
jgi:hypothetical protein